MDYLSEAVTVRLAREAVRGVAPSAGWQKMQVDVGGVSGFHRSYTDVERDIHSVNATNEKGDHVAYTVSPQIVHDMNLEFVMTVMAAVYCCKPSHFGGTGTAVFHPTAVVDGGVSADSFTVPAGGAFAAGTLIQTRGFTNAANNGIFEVAAGSGATSINVPTGTLVAEADPPDNALLLAVGLQGDAGDLSITADGHLLSAGAVDFTTKNIKVGSYVYFPSADEATAMGDAKFAFANTANTGFAEVTAVSANQVSLRHHTFSFVADAGAGKEIRVFFQSLFFRNWPLDDATNYFAETLSAEKEDVKPGVAADTRYTELRGCGANTLSIASPLNSKITATLGMVGMNASVPLAAADRFAGVAGAGNSPANAYEPLESATALVDAQNDLKVVRLGDANGEFQDSEGKKLKFNEWTYNHGNNVTPKGAQGVFGADDLIYGKRSGGASINLYHSVPDVIVAIDENRDGMWWDVIVKNHQFGWTLGMPNVALRNPQLTYAGNQPVMLSGDLVAFRDSTTGIQAALGMFGWLPTA